MPATEKAVMGGEGGGVRRLQDQVLLCIYERLLALRELAPEQENYGVAFIGNSPDDRIGESMPADMGVGISPVRLHSQRRIEEQDALLCPMLEIAMIRQGQSEIVADLLKDIDQRRRRLYALRYGKGEAVRLSWPVIRILAKDDDPHFFQRRVLKGIEYQSPWRVDRLPCRLLGLQEADDLPKIRLLELVGESGFPISRDLNGRQGVKT